MNPILLLVSQTIFLLIGITFSLKFFCELYVLFIAQMGEIHINKKYKLKIQSPVLWVIALVWSIFYLLCNIQ